MTSEVTLRIVFEIPSDIIDLLERLVLVLEDEYEQKYGEADDKD
jgi:hypothetical protein